MIEKPAWSGDRACDELRAYGTCYPPAMKRIACLLLVLLLAAPANAEPPAPFEDRVKILEIEMRRGPAPALEPYLKPEANTLSRQLAIRALGRIGDYGRAPHMLKKLLKKPDPHMTLILWAAGISRAKMLADSIAVHLSSKDPLVVATAAKALGWIPDERVPGLLEPLLRHKDTAVRAAALVGLSRTRTGELKFLTRASEFTNDQDADIRRAADLACWLLSGAYRTKAKEQNEDWDGEPVLCKRFLGHLKDEDADRRMAGLRVLGILLPKAIDADGPFPSVLALTGDADPRVVQDLIWRVLSKREGPLVTRALVVALEQDDPKTRQLAAEALGQAGRPAEATAALLERLEVEKDARMREVLAIALAQRGNEVAWDALSKRKDRASDSVMRQTTRARVLLASKRTEALTELFAWANAHERHKSGIHPAVWMTICGELDGRDDPRILEWLRGFFSKGWELDHTVMPYTIAAAIELAGANEIHELIGPLWALAGHPTPEGVHVEIRVAIAKALAELGAGEDCPAEDKKKIVAWLEHHMDHDPSAWVRRAAMESARELELEDVLDQDPRQPNDWRGLPRPEKPLPDWKLEGEGRWLDEAEVLRIADWIAQKQPRLVFRTTQGSFTVELDPAAAPVHSVNLLLAARAGIYRNTRWHRVVPNFVIQGGDPHGHGAGGGGWFVPDEINTRPYVRGELGMPKSTKDDGGCQVFVMHTTYHPLDERYTGYAHVVDGMETVDKIRVGDHILDVRVAVD